MMLLLRVHNFLYVLASQAKSTTVHRKQFINTDLVQILEGHPIHYLTLISLICTSAL